MSVNLTCNQVSALLSFYMDDRLNEQLKQFVRAHLENCPTCRAKYEILKNMVSNLKEAHERLTTEEVVRPVGKTSSSPQYKEFQTNLSAYIDNELTDEENIKIKKYVISNPKARGELENMYSFEKMLHSAFDKEKNEVKKNYTPYILKRIDIREEVYDSDSFAKIVTLFLILFTIFTISALMIFWI